MPGRRLTFGPFEVDQGAQIVLRDGEPLAVGQRGVLLLEALLRRPGEVITKSELMDAAWAGAAIEESNLSVQIAALRKMLGPSPEGGDWIATIPRVGYRFVGPSDPTPASSAADGRPSIAVLPFENLSSDPEQGYFADGLAEEILTALSKLPGILVIARNSSFAYRGANIDIRKVGDDLDVRHVLSGSVRRSGDRLRMSVRLADAAGGTQLWAETYDRRLSDVFAIQDDVTRQVVSVLRLKLTGTLDAAPGDASGTKDMEALDLFLRGRGLLASPNIDREINAQGIRLLDQALRRDPTYVDPHVNLVIGLVTEYSNRWTEAPAETIQAARRTADRGVELAPDYGEIRAASALVAMLEKDHQRLGEESEIAMSLSPLGSFANLMYGGYLVNDGRSQLAIPYYEQAIRANPGLTHLYIHHLGAAYLFAERYETAAALFRSRIVLSPKTDMSRAYLCVALGHLGAKGEAKRVWAELVSINPKYSLWERLNSWHYRNPADPERLFEGLRKAGLPTGARQS